MQFGYNEIKVNNTEKTIISKIQKNGPLTFAEFMNIALYDNENGYYTSGRAEIGKKGDFYTSPHVHSAFGEVIANFIIKAEKYLSNNDLNVIEIGSGKGYLAYDILNHINSASKISDNLNYIIIEKNNNKFIKELERFSDNIKIYNDISMLDKNISGIVVSNELFDSLPFHKIIYKEKNLHENYIDFINGNFTEITDEISDQLIIEYIERYSLNFSDSKQMEVCLQAGSYLKEISELLREGFILTIDYGSLSDELFSNEKPEGTYRCFHKHSVNTDIFSNIGSQDITADVDFSNLILSGSKYGLEKIKYTSQAQFLVDWGILDIYERTVKLDEEGSQAIKNLFMPGMMGNYFKVLIQRKNVEVDNGFYRDSELKISFGIT